VFDWILLYNTTAMSHLKGKSAIESKEIVIFLRTKTPDITVQFIVTRKGMLRDLYSGI
jgi:hypothetical protein